MAKMQVERQNAIKKCAMGVVIASLQAIESIVTDAIMEEEEEEPRRKGVRIENYMERTVKNFSDEQFRQHFRIRRKTYVELLSIIHNRMEIRRPGIALEKQVLSVLWILATPDSYRSISERFDLSKSSLSDCFFRIVKILADMRKEIIYWPTENEMDSVTNRFRGIAGVGNVAGAIDGTFIPIKQPAVDGGSYRTRKCNFAITLQSICDAELKFRDCFVGYPGSVSDTRIFRNSGFYKNCLENPQKYFPDPEMFIVGDKAYPLLEWCIPPYIDRGNLSEMQRNFNYKISQTRQVIERAFALLFGRFRRLKFLDMNRTDFIPATVIACCVLHNICLPQETNLEDYILAGAGNVDGNVDAEVYIRHERNMDDLVRRGSTKRDNLSHALHL